eukprot:TRINITY_DN1106_c0_g1_i3.p1 TRINITY_DN1106_c0_g1~~TRINITY_DN1106_c0_g1_i3.p1  ORF type:complete len:395 (+),score=74.30 TRINITY_DN1106_c0_g1_i3:64-1248(+)
MKNAPVELPMLTRPIERRKRNWDARAVWMPLAVGGIAMVWGVWFYNEVSEADKRMMMVFWAVWSLLFMLSCRDPGWITEQNHGKYASMFGIDSDGEVLRSEVSEGTLNRVARFDHHNTYFGMDVGKENYIIYHIFLLWGAAWGLAIFLTSLQYFAYQEDWHRPVFIPPFIWEGCLLSILAVQGYFRFLTFIYSIFCVGVRYLLGLDHWLLLTYAFSKANLLWGLYYTPIFIGCVLTWYLFGYSFIFVMHAFLMAACNMTLAESNVVVQGAAVPADKFASISGLLYMLWSDVVGAVGSMPYYRGIKVAKPGEVPEGYFLLDKNNGFWDMWGTLPCSFSKKSKNTLWANIKEIWNPSPPHPASSLRSQSAKRVFEENDETVPEVVVHDPKLAARGK